MKTIKNIVVVTLLIFSISSKAQIIIPVEDFYSHSRNGISDGTYVKDVNGVLNKFVGTWTGTHNNKNYELSIEKYTDIRSGKFLKTREKDGLRMRYKITDSNGAVIENILNASDNDDSFDHYLIMSQGLSTEQGRGYTFDYMGRDYNCGQEGWLYTSVFGANNEKLRLKLDVYYDVLIALSCKKGRRAEQVFPTEEMTLNKQ